MILRKFIEGRINNFHFLTGNGFLDICNFLRTFVNQKNQQMHFWIIVCNGTCHLLQQSRFSSFWLGHNHTTLSLSNRCNQIQHSHGNTGLICLQMNSFIWKNRSQFFKFVPMSQIGNRTFIDLCHIKKGTKFFILCPNPKISLYNITGTKSESPKESGRYIDIIISR